MLRAYLNATVRLLAAERWMLILATFGLGIIFSLAERYDSGFVIVDNIILLGAEAVFMHRLLVRGLGDGASARPRMMRLFGASLLSGTAVLFGLLLLIGPGLILVARWRLAWPLIMTRDMAIIEALGQSWTLTKGQASSLIVAMLVLWLPAIMIFAVLSGLMVMNASFEATLWFEMAVNLAAVSTALADCALSVAAHHKLVSPLDEGSDSAPDSRVYV